MWRPKKTALSGALGGQTRGCTAIQLSKGGTEGPYLLQFSLIQNRFQLDSNTTTIMKSPLSNLARITTTVDGVSRSLTMLLES